MAQVPPIDDSYIDDIIKSAGPFDPTLTTTQGIKLRELFKQLRDRIEQGSATPPFNPTAGTGVILSGTYPNIQIGVDVGRGPNQIVAKNENADIIVGRVAIIGADGAAGDDLSVGATVQLSNDSTVLASRAARMQLGDDGDIVFKNFTGPGDGTGSWFNRIRIKNSTGTLDYSEDLSARYSARSLVDKAYVDSKIGSGGGTSAPADATTTTKGIIQLGGDLAGTAASPTVPGLAGKANLNTANFFGAQNKFASAIYIGGNDYTVYGDGAIQRSVNGIPGILQIPYTAGTLAVLSDIPPVTPDATATVRGKILLAGDLSGTAGSPIVPGLSLKGNIAGGNTWTGNQIVNGTVTATSFVQSSERALKDNIQPYTGNALDKVNGIEISSFTYKSDEEKNLKVGFIADDTDSLFSTKDKNVMDIGTTLAISLKAIQELSAEIAQLKEKLNLIN